MNLERKRMMTPKWLFVVIGGWLGSVAAADLGPALENFADYEFGDSKKGLHEARMSAFRGADDSGVRRRHEQQLLDFVQSDATVEARRQACLWLSDLATDASVPVLEKLVARDGFSDVAQIALDALKEDRPAGGAATSAPGRFRADVLAADDKVELLARALLGKDEDLARVALTLVADGVVAKEACAWLSANIGRLSAERQVVAMNVLLQLDANEKEEVIYRVAASGKGLARTAAIRNLGRLGGLPHAEELLSLAKSSAGDAVSSAAREGLLSMPGEVIEKGISVWLGHADPALQAVAIELAAARGAASAADRLMRIASEEDHPNRKAAAAALGMAVPAEMLGAVVSLYAAAAGSPIEKELQGSVWMLARRQPDYEAAAGQLRAQAGKMPEPVRATLESMAAKLESLRPKVPLDQVRIPPPSGTKAQAVLLPGKHDAATPKRFEVAAYLNCGVQRKAEREGLTIECLNGEPWNIDPGIDPSLSLAFAGSSLDCSIRGLERDVDYILGMTWWDSDACGRRQTVFINGAEVLPDARPVAYDEGRPTPARIRFRLLPEHVADGAMNLSIRKLAGPNVVMSELWIMKRRSAAATKQILLVSGQDFPGHHWRETGPLVAEVLEADPRMEVTICESPYVLGLVHLGAYDAVFLHFKNYEGSLPSTRAMHDGLDRFVRAGGGMCLSHFACGAMEEWPEFVELSGRIWNGQGHDPRGPFEVRVVDKNHPVTRGLDDFMTDDELYFCLEGSPEIHLLCDARSKVRNADQPQAFVFHPGKGRVFMSTLGHDLKAYEAGEVRQLYQQATAWVVGLERGT